MFHIFVQEVIVLKIHEILRIYECLNTYSTISCVTLGRGDCESHKDTKCDFTKLHETKQEFVDGLYEYCDPIGQECSKCCLLYLTSTLKGDPCWYGIMRETAQFLITDHWEDRNVTNMLLTCEHLHNLDQLLSEPKKHENSNAQLDSAANVSITHFLVISLAFIGWLVMAKD